MSSPPSALGTLRPLRMGELIDRSASLWRQHAWAFFRINVGFSLALYGLSKLFLLGVARWAPLFRGGDDFASAMAGATDAAMHQLPAMVGLILAFSATYAWVNWNAWVAASDYAIGAWLGHEVSVEKSLRRALRRAAAATTSFAVAGLYAVAAIVACMIPGGALMAAAFAWVKQPGAALALAVIGAGLLGLGLLAGFLFCLLRFLLTCQVLAVEDAGGLQAIRRSGSLISGRIGPGTTGWVKVRATILLTAVAAVLFAVLFVSGLPAMIIQAIFGNAFDPAHATPDAVPQALLVPAELFQIAVESIFSPLYLAFAAVFYVDMRVRREGLDLELQLDREAA